MFKREGEFQDSGSRVLYQGWDPLWGTCGMPTEPALLVPTLPGKAGEGQAPGVQAPVPPTSSHGRSRLAAAIAMICRGLHEPSGGKGPVQEPLLGGHEDKNLTLRGKCLLGALLVLGIEGK